MKLEKILVDPKQTVETATMVDWRGFKCSIFTRKLASFNIFNAFRFCRVLKINVVLILD